MPGEQRGVLQGEVLGALGQEVLRRGLHAVLAVAEQRDVEVVLQDLVLGVLLLRGEGELDLPHLATLVRVHQRGLLLLVAGGDRLVEQHVLDPLLGQRRGALGVTAGGVVRDRAQDALRVGAVVLVEPRVLDRDRRLAHRRRHVRQRHEHAVLVVEGGHRRAVGPQDPRLLRQRADLQLLGQRVEELHPAPGQLAGGPDGGHEQPGHHHPREHRRGDEAGEETEHGSEPRGATCSTSHGPRVRREPANPGLRPRRDG